MIEIEYIRLERVPILEFFKKLNLRVKVEESYKGQGTFLLFVDVLQNDTCIKTYGGDFIRFTITDMSYLIPALTERLSGVRLKCGDITILDKPVLLLDKDNLH